MPATKKIEQVESLQQVLKGASIVIGTNYAGLTVAQMEALRKALKQGGAEYKVVKNRLVQRAAEQLGQDELEKVLKGPMALVIGRGDPAESIKVLTTYIKTSRVTLPLTGALVSGRALTAMEVEALATMPPREVLLGQVLGSMQGVLRGLVTVLNSHLSGLVTVLEQRRKQLEQLEERS